MNLSEPYEEGAQVLEINVSIPRFLVFPLHCGFLSYLLPRVMLRFLSDSFFSNAQEMNVDLIKLEPKEEDESEQNINVAEEENSITSRQVGTVTNVNVWYCFKILMYTLSCIVIQDRELMLIRQSSHDFALVSNLYSLLEDYKTMASSGKSLLCCQPPLCQAIVMCLLCGENFMVKADRLLQLCKHFESSHPLDASELILEAMERYGKLISHMRKALEFDELFLSTNYKPETKMSLPSYM